MKDQREMSPQLAAEANAVFAHWKGKGEYDKAFFYCMIEKEKPGTLIAEAAKLKFQEMYDAAVKELDLTPVMPEAKPKFIWRNGARVKVA